MAVILLGFITGCLASAAWINPPNRALAAIELFETYCVKFAKHHPIPSTQHLTRMELIPGTVEWVDPKSKIVLEFDKRRCRVSDGLLHFNEEERKQFATETFSMVKESFPMLEPSDPQGLNGWESFLLWSQYSKRDPRYWALILTRHSFVWQDATTSLSVSISAN